MRRIFAIELSNRFRTALASNIRYEVVATNAEKAIAKALSQAKKDELYKSGWLVELVRHRGPAV